MWATKIGRKALILKQVLNLPIVKLEKMGKFYRIGVSNRINYRWKLYHKGFSAKFVYANRYVRTTNQQK